MELKTYLYVILAISILSLIGLIFWEQEYKFAQPTPKPENLKKVNILNVHFAVSLDKNTYTRFYNYDGPFSRFNIREFQSIIRKYPSQVRFIAVLQTDDNDRNAVNGFKKKYDLGTETLHESKGEIAQALGVYSTPQAVTQKENTLFYRGNYNKARFCLSGNTRFAEIAYGCELPSNSTKKYFYNFL